MTKLLTPIVSDPFANRVAAGALLILLTGGSFASSAVLLMPDPVVPTEAAVATLDPELFVPNQRGVAGTRELRQTFQNAADFLVGEIILSIDTSGADGGLVVDFYEVADVDATTWTPLGDPIETISLPVTTDLPDTTSRLSLVLTESSLFTLPARNTGTEGYGIEISNVDATTNIGLIRHSNSGTDDFPLGRYYTETGGQSGTGTRDFGVWLLASTALPPVLGDTDGDGVVELEDDLNPIRMNYLQPVTMRAQGDLNGDDVVTFADFREWKTGFLMGGGSLADIDPSFPSVPEPSAIALALVGSAGAVWLGFGGRSSSRGQILRQDAGCGMRKGRVKSLSRLSCALFPSAMLILLVGGSWARSAVTITADPQYPNFPNVFTTDPLLVTNGNRGITADRNLRQTFKNPTTIDVGEIVLGFDVNTPTGGMVIDFYEVDDVLAAAWTPGALVHTISIPDLTVATNQRLGITLTEADVFELPARFADTTGYGIELSNFDVATTIGTWAHTLDGIDHYPDGAFYTETGELSGADPLRDVGVALRAANAPPVTPGDVNGDMNVNIADVEIIAANFRQNASLRSMGDLTGNGFVDLLDFRNWKANFPGAFPASASGSSSPAVPEPATVFAAIVGLLGITRQRRRRAADVCT
jgi:hypothetical protein